MGQRIDPLEFAGPEPIAAAWQCDLTDNRLSWSPEVYDLFGLPRGSPLDRDAIVAMYCDESRGLLEQLRSWAIADCGSFTFEARIRRPDGELRWMRVSADVEMRDGRAVRLYGIKQDITDEMRG